MKYSDLTPQQKAYICNGCGGKGGWIKPPDFLFVASCDRHDFNYYIGGNEEDRLRYDTGFYGAMDEDIENAVKNKKRFEKYCMRAFYRFWAWSYLKVVRSRGSKYFNYGEKKTMKDLEKDMGIFYE